MNRRWSRDSSPDPCPSPLLCSFLNRQCSGLCAAHFLHCQLRSCDSPSSFGEAFPQSHRRLALPWGLALAVITLECGLRSALGQLGQAPWGPKGQRKEAGSRLVGSRWWWPWGVSRLLPNTSSFLSGPFTSLSAPYQVHHHFHSGVHPPPSCKGKNQSCT